MIPYQLHMSWIESLFQKILQPTIQIFHFIGVAQCLSADKELVVIMAEKLKGAIVPAAWAVDRPIDRSHVDLSMSTSIPRGGPRARTRSRARSEPKGS